MTCPKCGKRLVRFSGVERIRDFWFCPRCVNAAYDENGEILFLLE